jgi:hypothetical protein
MRKLILFVSACALLLPAMAIGQTMTLADLSRQEEARRKGINKPARVYTNADLRIVIESLPVTTTNPNAGVGEPGSQVPSVNLPGGKPEDPPVERDQAYWSARINAARSQLERSRVFGDALQSRINAMQAEIVNRDDPGQRMIAERERARAMAELDRVKKEIADQTKAISDIEEEARKAGVPPGWLR